MIFPPYRSASPPLCEQGWEEGMLGMKKAGRRLIVVPPNLAYGSKGVPNCVPANSTLIFEAELRRVTSTEQSLYFLHWVWCHINHVYSTSVKWNIFFLFCALGEVFQGQWLWSGQCQLQRLCCSFPSSQCGESDPRGCSTDDCLRPRQTRVSQAIPNSIFLNFSHVAWFVSDLSCFIHLFFSREPQLRAKSNSLSEQLAVSNITAFLSLSMKPLTKTTVCSYFTAVVCHFLFKLQNPDASKAKLISRMAKMGQPMLPFLTGVASQPESSDSELEVGMFIMCFLSEDLKKGKKVILCGFLFDKKKHVMI